MRLLLDSHTLFWWLRHKTRLSQRALSVIESENNKVFVSIATAWEMAIKAGSGKWPDTKPLLDVFEREMELSDFNILEIKVPHVCLAGLMPSPHRDPFDRLLAAQAAIEGLTLVSSDAKMANLGAEVLW